MNIINCPHCDMSILIEEMRCGIFRCGMYKESFKQVDPHLSKAECEKLGDTIYGCSKPFQIKNNEVVKCDYI